MTSPPLWEVAASWQGSGTQSDAADSKVTRGLCHQRWPEVMAQQDGRSCSSSGPS